MKESKNPRIILITVLVSILLIPALFILIQNYIRKKEKKNILENSSIHLKMEGILGANFTFDILISSEGGKIKLREKREYIFSGETRRGEGTATAEEYLKLWESLKKDNILKIQDFKENIADANHHEVSVKTGDKEHSFHYQGFSQEEANLVFAENVNPAPRHSRIIQQILRFSRKHIDKVDYRDIDKNQYGEISLLLVGTDPLGKAVFSPDSQFVYFNKINEDTRYVYRMSLQTKEQDIMCKGMLMDITPDGKYLIVTQEGSLFYFEIESRFLNLISDKWEIDVFYENLKTSNRYVAHAQPFDKDNNSIYLFDLEERTSGMIYSMGENVCIAISPDERKVIFFHYGKGSDTGREVISYDTKSQDLKRLSFFAGSEWYPVAFGNSPDEIMVVRQGAIGIFDTKTLEIKTLLEKPHAFFFHLSPDKQKLFFCTAEKEKQQMPQQLYRYDFATGETIQITSYPLTFLNPEFSPKGDMMVFKRFDDLFLWKENPTITPTTEKDTPPDKATPLQKDTPSVKKTPVKVENPLTKE